MKAARDRVLVQDLLTQVARPERVDASRTYRILGARWYAKGLYIKETKSGSDVRARDVFRVQEGDFVYNRLFAWMGSFALAGPEHAGCYVSNEFQCFRPSADRVDARYLFQFFSQTSTWEAARLLSSGSTPTSRNRLKAAQFLNMLVPCPPLVEQRRMSEKIDRLLGLAGHAAELLNENSAATRFLWKAFSNEARVAPYDQWALGEVVDFLDGRRIPLSARERVLRQGAIPYYGASGVIDHVDDYLYDEDLVLLSEDGANLINRSTPIAFIARGKYWVNNHAHVIKPKSGVDLDLEYLELVLADYDVESLNFASAQAKLNQSNAQRIKIPVPPLEVQKRAVQRWAGIRERAHAIAIEHDRSAQELQSLCLSIYAQAFGTEPS